MPIYIYKCGKCGDIDEYLLLDGETPNQCKKCGEVGGLERSFWGQTVSTPASKQASEPPDYDNTIRNVAEECGPGYILGGDCDGFTDTLDLFRVDKNRKPSLLVRGIKPCSFRDDLPEN